MFVSFKKTVDTKHVFFHLFFRCSRSVDVYSICRIAREKIHQSNPKTNKQT